jgi:hypothetical protein
MPKINVSKGVLLGSAPILLIILGVLSSHFGGEKVRCWQEDYRIDACLISIGVTVGIACLAWWLARLAVPQAPRGILFGIALLVASCTAYVCIDFALHKGQLAMLSRSVAENAPMVCLVAGVVLFGWEFVCWVVRYVVLADRDRVQRWITAAATLIVVVFPSAGLVAVQLNGGSVTKFAASVAENASTLSLVVGAVILFITVIVQWRQNRRVNGDNDGHPTPNTLGATPLRPQHDKVK